MDIFGRCNLSIVYRQALFLSLKAAFSGFFEDRPDGDPQCCLFSDLGNMDDALSIQLCIKIPQLLLEGTAY